MRRVSARQAEKKIKFIQCQNEEDGEGEEPTSKYWKRTFSSFLGPSCKSTEKVEKQAAKLSRLDEAQPISGLSEEVVCPPHPLLRRQNSDSCNDLIKSYRDLFGLGAAPAPFLLSAAAASVEQERIEKPPPPPRVSLIDLAVSLVGLMV